MAKKPIKKKKCRECGSMFTPWNTTQICCSGKCAIGYTRKRKEEQSKKLELFKKEINTKKRIASALETTRLLVHEYIRERDKGLNCISCQRPWSKDFQAGHYYKAELYSSLKFHLKNIHGQCETCNQMLDGNLNEYSIYLPLRIGVESFEELRRLAILDKQNDLKWDLEDLKKIRDEIRPLLKSLKKRSY